MSCLTSNFGEKVKTVQGGWKYSDNVGNIRTVFELFGRLFVCEIHVGNIRTDFLGQEVFLSTLFPSTFYFWLFPKLSTTLWMPIFWLFVQFFGFRGLIIELSSTLNSSFHPEKTLNFKKGCQILVESLFLHTLRSKVHFHNFLVLPYLITSFDCIWTQENRLKKSKKEKSLKHVSWECTHRLLKPISFSWFILQ